MRSRAGGRPGSGVIGNRLTCETIRAPAVLVAGVLAVENGKHVAQGRNAVGGDQGPEIKGRLVGR